MKRVLCSVLLFFLSVVHVNAADYSKTESWINLPQTAVTSVDCFYLYPTIIVDSADGKMNIPIDDSYHRTAGEIIFNYQASVFNSSCNLYAPYYELACMLALGLPLDEANKFLDVAYDSVRQAFLNYLEKSDRPFILAGHSQGAVMLKMLLSEFMKDEKISKRFVAGYLFGIDISEEYMRNNPHLKFAETSDDIGVLLTYNSRSPEAVNADLSNFLSVSNLKSELTINPLNWKRDSTYAPASLNMGAVFIHRNEKGEYEKQEIPNFADAQVDQENGLLIVANVSSGDKKLSLPGFPQGVYHVAEISLFYKNIEQNAHDRINSYFEKHK